MHIKYFFKVNINTRCVIIKNQQKSSNDAKFNICILDFLCVDGLKFHVSPLQVCMSVTRKKQYTYLFDLYRYIVSRPTRYRRDNYTGLPRDLYIASHARDSNLENLQER